MFQKITHVTFPAFRGLSVNMLPFIMGDESTLPPELHGYLPLIGRCEFEHGKLAYLTVHESLVRAGESQRRPGIHTEGTSCDSWGGGGWGGGEVPVPPVPPQKPEPKKKRKGLYMASSDGACRIWNCSTYDVDRHGGLLSPPTIPGERMLPGELVWLTDRTPHEALPVEADTRRQFFRLVSHEVSGWWAQHSTANPLGVQPDCRIFEGSKFDGGAA